MAAGPVAAESSMEARIARVESDVTHLLSDVTEIKADVRGLRDRMDAGNAKLAERIDAVASQLNAKIDVVKDSLAAAKTWALILYVALAATMLGTMARGFGWL
jgi:hypothetical protein